MAGWANSKRVAVERAFYAYLNRCYVNSKDAGRICLGECLYEGQRQVITQIFDALEADIHKIFILKSRQLGISTIIRAFTIFLLGVHKGLKGAIVFDTDNNRTEARAEIEVMINDLPASLKFPKIDGNNRAGLSLANDSKVLFMSAGVRKSKTSGTLGRSVGLTIAHLSELCSYDNDEGLEAFEQSLSEVHPDRLYIYESTARGFNRWHQMWQEARNDPHHCKCIFLGWMVKDSQRIDRDSVDFTLYGEAPPTEQEREKIALVKKLYNYDITPEQLAWVRRKYNPSATADNLDAVEDEADPVRTQEQPWTEDEAFQQTGSIFFPAKQLTDQTVKHVSNKYQRWMYIAGAEFTDMKIYPAPTLKMTDLKVWEEPDPDGVYIIGCDPAFGENPENDRSGMQIMRCYSDGLDQVAEYASPLVSTRQLAWVIASLLGWYGSGNAQVCYVLELNGPGQAVFNALKELRFQLEQGYFGKDADEKGLIDIFRNVRTYIYTRPDGMTAGQNYHFKTNAALKVMIMERLRDFVSNGSFRIRSQALVEEMKTIARDGDSISAPQNMRDDLVLSAAFAGNYWETKIRKDLITQRKTRASEEARKRLSIHDQVKLFNQSQLGYFFQQKVAARQQVARQQSRARWRAR